MLWFGILCESKSILLAQHITWHERIGNVELSKLDCNRWCCEALSLQGVRRQARVQSKVKPKAAICEKCTGVVFYTNAPLGGKGKTPTTTVLENSYEWRTQQKVTACVWCISVAGASNYPLFKFFRSETAIGHETAIIFQPSAREKMMCAECERVEYSLIMSLWLLAGGWRNERKTDRAADQTRR